MSSDTRVAQIVAVRPERCFSGGQLTLRGLVALGLLWVVPGYCPATAQSTSTLAGATSGNFRWKDVAGNAYSTDYRTDYSYTHAHVVVTYTTNATILSGTLTASDPKPNFAYQFKLSGEPETDPTGNENLGFSGRWWQESWNGSLHNRAPDA